MSLLSKLERLERAIGSKSNDELSEERMREAAADMLRLLDEIAARPKPTIPERIAWLREAIMENEALAEQGPIEEQIFGVLNWWSRKELARLEAEFAKLQ